MRRIFRIVFCILSCACAAAAVLVGALVGWEYFLYLAAGGVIFGALMVICKRTDSSEPALPPPDFDEHAEEMPAPPSSEDENGDKK